jgi:hypothetical protein
MILFLGEIRVRESERLWTREIDRFVAAPESEAMQTDTITPARELFRRCHLALITYYTIVSVTVSA